MLEMSLAIVDAPKKAPSASLSTSCRGKTNPGSAELQKAFDKRSNQICQNAIRLFVPKKIIGPFLAEAGVPPEKLSNQINSEERESLINLMKSLRFDIKGAYSMATAMVTAGGVSLKEVDPRTMASKLVEGLYLVGEILDLDAGTGGFNLQAAFSTGYIAGESAAAFIFAKH